MNTWGKGTALGLLVRGETALLEPALLLATSLWHGIHAQQRVVSQAVSSLPYSYRSTP